MKLAKLNDIKRGLEARTADDAPSINSLVLESLPGFVDASIQLQTATFLAICGGTGVGKSALLELFYHLLSSTEPNVPSLRLGNCKGAIQVSMRDQTFSRSLTVSPDGSTNVDVGAPPRCTIVGLADRTSVAQSFFRTSDIDALKEGVAGRELPENLKSIVAYICRTTYNKITFFEIEYQPDSIMPFFEAICDGATYDSRTMATGELSVLYLAWVTAFSEPRSILLIEEPEAFLPPLSHQYIFGLICRASMQNHHAFIISTHSAEIASQFHEDNLLSIRTQSGKSVVPSTRESKLRVLSRLGLLPTKLAILFVEDDLARIVLEELLQYYEFNVSATLEIDVRAGDGGVNSALKGLPTELSSLTFLGVLDGDVKTAAQKWPVADKLVFLPFPTAMESEFLGIIDAKPGAFAKDLGRTLPIVEDALAAHTGADHHDRFAFLADDLGIPQDTLARSCFKLWFKTSGSKALARRFATELSRKLGVALPD